MNSNFKITKFVFKNKFICLLLCCTFLFFSYHFLSSKLSFDKNADAAPDENFATGSTGFEKIKYINECSFEKSNNFNSQRTNDGPKFTVGILSNTLELSTSISVFYREAKPGDGRSKGDILLLHGAAFSSEIWDRLGTMQILATSGFRVVAIDQPGFKRKTNGSYDSDRFLMDLCRKLNFKFPAIISPSASGRFSAPFFVSGLAGAFVPIAPCCTNKYSLDYWKNITTPTLILHGESDTVSPSKFLLATPNHVLRIIKDAGHSVYVDQTKLFHDLILNFFNYLTTTGSHRKTC